MQLKGKEISIAMKHSVGIFIFKLIDMYSSDQESDFSSSQTLSSRTHARIKIKIILSEDFNFIGVLVLNLCNIGLGAASIGFEPVKGRHYGRKKHKCTSMQNQEVRHDRR